MDITANKKKSNKLLIRKLKEDYGIAIPSDVIIEEFNATNNIDVPVRGIMGPGEISMKITKQVGNKSIAMQIEIQERM